MTIAGTLILICIMYVGTDIGVFYTNAARMSKIAVPKGIQYMTNFIGSATTWIGWVWIKVCQLINAAF